MCGSGFAGPRFNQALWDTGDSLDALPGYVQDEARAPIIRDRWRKMAVMHQGSCPQSQVGNYIAGFEISLRSSMGYQGSFVALSVATCYACQTSSRFLTRPGKGFEYRGLLIQRRDCRRTGRKCRSVRETTDNLQAQIVMELTV